MRSETVFLATISTTANGVTTTQQIEYQTQDQFIQDINTDTTDYPAGCSVKLEQLTRVYTPIAFYAPGFDVVPQPTQQTIPVTKGTSSKKVVQHNPNA